MQSGISVSNELHQAFNELVSSPDQRGLLAGIEKEQLVALEAIPSHSAEFSSDLKGLTSLLKDNEAAYVILRRYEEATDGYVAITYVPDTANVRQKMLFASSRLTLVRELGIERFRETLFATTKDDLTAEGFQSHDKHESLNAPLTEEEKTLEDVKQAEAEASRGTSARSSHVNHGMNFPMSEEAATALTNLKESEENLVQLRIDLPTEQIELAKSSMCDADDISQAISEDEPRFSFYRYTHEFEAQHLSPIFFVYTCPSGAKIKERMVYASARASVIAYASYEAGLEVQKKLEASSPSEITEAILHEEFHPKKAEKTGFSKPKRPGRR
ncbi:MAG: Twinfilin-1 [Peltula sp. TS41687]|nr:MAG: Twinfilin-1 [Peltula sp. TS41687]